MKLVDIEPLMKNGWHLVQTGESNRFLRSKSLADVPIVDAMEVVHGRWISTYKVNWWTGTSDRDGFVCSRCARHFKSKLRFNYCPNCGAKMDGERKDNEET